LVANTVAPRCAGVFGSELVRVGTPQHNGGDRCNVLKRQIWGVLITFSRGMVTNAAFLSKYAARLLWSESWLH